MSVFVPRKILAAFPRFVAFVFHNFPLAYWSLVIVIAGVILEYAALSVMIPLGSGIGAGAASENGAAVVHIWRTVAARIGLPVDNPRTWLWLFLLFFAMRMVVGLAQTVVNTAVAKLIHSQLSSSTFSAVVSRVAIQEIYKRSVGHYMALAGDDSIRVGQLFFTTIQTVSALLSAMIGLFVLYLYSDQVFWVTMIFLFSCGLVLGFLARRIIVLSAESGQLSRAAVTVFVEVLNGLRSIRSMAGERYVNDRYSIALRRYAKILFSIDIYNHSSRTLPGLLLVVLGLVFLFPTAGFLGEVSVVYFFTMMTLLVRVLSFLGVAVYSGGRAAVDIRAAFDLEYIIDLLAKVESGVHGQKILSVVREITLVDLTCGYTDGRPVLQNANAQLTCGKCYALTGGSGSGKSTLSDVLLGMLSPSAGEVRIDGIPYGQIDTRSLRRKVVLVEQQTRIFSGSVRENIEFGLETTEADLEAAVKVADLSEFLASLKDGLETQLEYQGSNISGGQRQRIGLARAVLRRPDVLILDEATSALDAQTRDVVLLRLREQYRDKIILFITHDQNVIDGVDEVWLLEQGRLSVTKK